LTHQNDNDIRGKKGGDLMQVKTKVKAGATHNKYGLRMSGDAPTRPTASLSGNENNGRRLTRGTARQSRREVKFPYNE